jgi:putative tryptophan/tyrosine transport system substrate-binding protein
LELLKEIVPKLSRMAVVVSSSSADYPFVAKELELAAERLELKIQLLDITKLDLQTVFRDAVSARAQAVLFRVPGPVLNPRRTEIAALALKSRLPVIYESAQEVEAGRLVSYGIESKALFRRAAIYVRQDRKRRQAGRFARRAADEFRARYQS